MDPARLLRLHRARVLARDADVLRPRTALGQRRADRPLVHRLNGALRAIVDAAAVVVFAPACAACDAPLAQPSRGAVCPGCWRSILPVTPPVCDACGDPLSHIRAADVAAPLRAGASHAAIGRCARCRIAPHVYDRARAIGPYDGALRAIVHALKYGGRRSLAQGLARLMRERGADMLADASCVVPVPLHPSRKRQRGFNQAVDLARHLGRPCVDALVRVRPTATQTELPADERHRNVRGAFASTRAARTIAGAVVVLVDDVSTTGATLDACAAVLKEAGAREVRALTAARVIGSAKP